MIISTSNVIAVRCPECGGLDFHLLSLFSLNKRKKQIKLACSCGTSLVFAGTKDWKKFWLQVNCLMCEIKHIFYLSRKQLFNSQLEIFYCEETGVDIGYVGVKDNIITYVQNQDASLREMAEEMGFGDYFDSPEVMYETLDCLYDMTENNKLNCECGSYQIDIEAFPEKLELTCVKCGCKGFISAESEHDLSLIKESSGIKLSKKGFNLKKRGKLTKRSK